MLLVTFFLSFSLMTQPMLPSKELISLPPSVQKNSWKVSNLKKDCSKIKNRGGIRN